MYHVLKNGRLSTLWKQCGDVAHTLSFCLRKKLVGVLATIFWYVTNVQNNMCNVWSSWDWLELVEVG
jgi:hypothetical protein